MGKFSIKNIDKKRESNFLNKNIDFKNFDFTKILAVSFIFIIIIALGISIFKEFRGEFPKESSDSKDDAEDKTNQTTLVIEYDCNYIWFQQIIEKATNKLLWTCNSARPYCKAGTTQCCKWTQATGHYDCADARNLTISNDANNQNDNNNVSCVDSDHGKDIWATGTCNGAKDYCTQNFETELIEYVCTNNICTEKIVDCHDYSATCYDGRCIGNTKDSDGDGALDLDEYEYGTNPNDPNTHNQNNTNLVYCCTMSGAKNCYTNHNCTGYGSLLGSYNSLGECNNQCLKWHCCTASNGTKTCRLNGCNAGETYSSTGYTSQSQCQANCTSSPPPIPSVSDYDCNYNWHQEIINKTTRQLIWTCPETKEYCKAGTSQCCKWTQAAGYYDCVDMISQAPFIGCVDSDAGMSGLESLQTKGNCTKESYTASDFCWDSSILSEATCVNNACTSNNINCQQYFGSDSSCQNGRCVISWKNIRENQVEDILANTSAKFGTSSNWLMPQGFYIYPGCYYYDFAFDVPDPLLCSFDVSITNVRDCKNVEMNRCSTSFDNYAPRSQCFKYFNAYVLVKQSSVTNCEAQYPTLHLTYDYAEYVG